MSDKVSLATLALAKAYTDAHGGGSGTDNYNDLTHLPTVNGVEFKGTMTGETIGLVDAVSGKGLSTNDYTDADKTIVGGVTSALSGKADVSTVNAILDGQSIDSFGDVETALGDKTDLDVISPEFSSHNMYAVGEYTIYNGEFYMFTAQHEGEWTGTDVIKRSVAGALDYKADYSTVEDILNGQSIDSFGDVETALGSKFSWSDNADIGAHNLLPYPYSQTGVISASGITYTDKGDGSIDVSAGTATNNAEFFIYGYGSSYPADFEPFKGKFLSKGAESNAYLRAWYFDGTKTFLDYQNFSATGNLVNAPAGTKYVTILLRTESGSTTTATTLYPMLKDANDTVTTFTSPVKTNKDLTEDVMDIWKANGVVGAKNINASRYNTGTINGVTWSYDENGVFEAHATSPATGETSRGSYFTAPFDAQVVVSGCNSGDTGIHIYPYDNTMQGRPYTDSTLTTQLSTNDNVYRNNEISFFMQKGHKIGLVCRVVSGKTPNHVKFYPMLRLAADTDSTYAPYAMTNKELTDSKVDWETNAKLGAKNLLPYANYGTEADGEIVDHLQIGYNRNDGTVKLNNYLETDDYSKSLLIFYLDAGNYILTGIPSGLAGVKLKLVNMTDSNAVIGYDTGDGLSFTLSGYKKLNLVMEVTKDAPFNNDVISPMIRYATDTDTTFVPYTMTNKDITKNIVGLNHGLSLVVVRANGTTGTNSDLDITVDRDVNFAMVLGSNIKTVYDLRAYEPFVSSYSGSLGSQTVTLRFAEQGTQNLMASGTAVDINVLLAVKYV